MASIFKKAVAKKERIILKITEEDKKTIEGINKKLSELDEESCFDIEEILYNHLTATLKAAEKEIKKLDTSKKESVDNKTQDSKVDIKQNTNEVNREGVSSSYQ